MIVIGIDPGAANTGFGVVRTINDRMVARALALGRHDEP